MGVPHPKNCHPDRFGEGRDLIPQAGSGHSAKKKTFRGRNDSILRLPLPFSLAVCVSQKEKKRKSQQEPSLPAALPDGSPLRPARKRRTLVS